MIKDRVLYDYTFMSSKFVGKGGFEDKEIESLYPKLERVKKGLVANKKSCALEFACLPYATTNLDVILDKASDLCQNYSTMVVIGIGGSDLGTRAVYEALGSRNGCSLVFLGDTPDPNELTKFLSATNLAKTCFNFVSRSGETIEILAVYSFLKDKLNASQVIVTTGQSGYLREEAKKRGYFLFDEPKNVGDRFSVLSVVSLLPLGFVGLNIRAFLDGARVLADLIDLTEVRDDPMLLYSCLAYLAYSKRKQSISILMPYSNFLAGFGKWHRQLFAESLGKDGIGLTPVDLIGPRDQHSFLQLLNDGPKDKTVTFVRILGLDTDLKVSELKEFKDVSLFHLLETELSATAKTLAKNKVPNGTLFVPRLTEHFLGQLFYFMEIACSYLGMLFDIDPFNQPGVEENKELIAKLLSEERKDQVGELII